MSKSKKATPVMRQFWNAKKSHPDSLMLFRMGDFYETFEQDAEIASNVLGITLTKRSNGAASSVPLAGFPYHALERHLHKLLKAGHKVAICEQVEDPKIAKGIVKREVIEIVTPGTSLSEKYLDRNENNYLGSIIYKENNYGFAVIDISTSEFYTVEVQKKDLLNTIQKYNPKEILISEEQREEISIILDDSKFFLTPYQSWIWDESFALDELRKVFKVNSLKGFGIENMPLAIGAAGAITHYLRTKLMRKLNHLTGIKCIHSLDKVLVDASTIRNLEIFNSLSNQGVHGTLISIIDKTTTAAGSRLLKKWIKEPLLDKKRINNRLDNVEELIINESIRDSIKQDLKEVSDIQRIISRLSSERASPRDVFQLGKSLELLKKIKNDLPKKAKALTKMLSESKNTNTVINIIYKTLTEDPPSAINKGRFIRKGYSKKLDEIRNLSDNASEWIIKYQNDERNITGINSLKIGYNRVFGYYIDVTKTHQDKVPEYYIRKQTLTNSERYFTPILKEYEEKILSSEDQLIQLELEIFKKLRSEILQYTTKIYHNSIILAKIDIATSLAQIANDFKYIRPELLNNSHIELKGSRHPVVEQLIPLDETFIPNNILLKQDSMQIAVITGPNMAGKSTFLRQLGITVIMAQIGSFVPATSARIGLVDKLFTRVGASDNLAGGESTFMVEMNETANILNNATSKSLVLLDEIGRGTSTFDGLSIAWAVTEFLHNNKETAAMTIFATHYHELVELANKLPRAFNLTVEVKEFGDKVVFLRKIKKGAADRSYGIHVAEMAGIPKPVIIRSNEILKQLLSSDKTKLNISHNVSNMEQISFFEKQLIEFKYELDKIDINKMTPMEAIQKLNELKEKHGL